MKKLLVIALALTLTVACNQNTSKKTEQTAEPVATTPKETPDLTNYGITAGENPTGLTTGQKVPDVTLHFENGAQKKLSELYGGQPLVVFFYRGYWCPFCSKYLSEMATQAKKLEYTGAKLIAITPETYENVQKAKDASQATFDIVSDKDGAIMKAFKVNFDVTEDYQGKLKKGLDVTLQKDNATGEAVLPIPATYVIDKTGTIVYSFNNPDYKERAPIEEILQHIPANN